MAISGGEGAPRDASRFGRRRLPFWRQLASGGAIVLGAAALFGWWLRVPWLTSVVPSWPTMKPTSGLLAVLSGIALLLVEPERPRRMRFAAKVVATIVGALAIASIAERLAGSAGVVGRVLTGRTIGGPLLRTAFAFAVIAAATVTVERVTPRGRSPTQLLALIAGSLGFVALLGFVFGVPALRGGEGIASGGMSIQTAAALVLLSSALLVIRPHVGLMSAIASEHTGGLVARRLLLGLLAFAPVALAVVAGRRFGLYGDAGFTALLVFLALVEGIILIHVTALRLNDYDVRQKGAEALIRQSEQRFSQLIGHAPDGIFIADLDGQYTDVNEAGCRLLGLSRADIVGKAIVDFIPPGDVPLLWQQREELLGGSVSVNEWSLRHRDGHYVSVEISAAILPDGRWQGFVRDISDRKRAEAELAAARENDRQLRAELQKVMGAATSVSESVAELPRPDITAVLQTIALQAQALTGARYVAVGLGTDPERPIEPWVSLGMSADTVHDVGRPPRPTGMLAADVVPENARSIRVDDVRRDARFRDFPPLYPDMASFISVPIRYRRRHIGNVYLANRAGEACFTAQDQRMVEMLAARAAVALETAKLYAGEAQQRAWLRSVIEQLPEGVVILDRHGRVVTTNRALLSFLNDGRGSLEGRELHGFELKLPNGAPIPPDDLPSTCALQRGESSMGRELALLKPGNGLVPVLANAAPIRDDTGAITGATIIIQDITARKELERLREEWASVIAHDLRQPVSAIALSADALEMVSGPNLPEKGAKAIARIRAASTRLGRMVDDLFDASRIEANRLSVAQRAVDLGELAASVADGLRDEMGDHDLLVDAAPAQIAWIDPDRIQQVLANLLTNAAKYGAPGSEIHVDVSDRGEAIEVAVTNHGPGIAAEEIPRLFERFWRARKARGSGTPGAGLGLYIAKGLVEANGGRIWVDSTPGETTTFHVLLPRAPAGAEIDAHGPQLHA
ncbi:MAG TPA: PAS domain S-box protein [Polyangia bacterium]|nr:PAS domain S-box protein [Polyangia bacterium]